MLFRPIPLSVSLAFLGEGQKVQIGTAGATPVFSKRSDGGWDVEIGDIAGFAVEAMSIEQIGQWIERFQTRHPEIVL